MITSSDKVKIESFRIAKQKDQTTAKSILIVDNSEISKRQVRKMLESADFIVYHTNSMQNIENYQKDLQIDLIIINQSIFLKENEVLERIVNIKIPMLILASLIFDNLNIEINKLRNADILRILKLPKSDTRILREINTMINNYEGKHDNGNTD